MLRLKPLVGALICGLAVAACNPAETPTPTPDAEEMAAAQRFEAIGVVRSLSPRKTTVVIDHEEIPGFMDAMVMPFPVKDPTILDGIEPNMRVRFWIIHSSTSSYVQRIEVLPEGS